MLPAETHVLTRLRDAAWRVAGTVQGVGFRPFVARLAARHGVHGWVRNDGRGVTLRVRGPALAVEAFREALTAESPPAARITAVEAIAPIELVELPATGDTFRILDSVVALDSPEAAVTPDLALCPDCRRELLDPRNRRHNYPFLNCTNCGPRYSIVRALPYDRRRTTMAKFAMCPDCRREYRDPVDRRFHAQPNACAKCGPHITLLDPRGGHRAVFAAAIAAAVGDLRAGRIVAVKGIGGFHLFVDACNEPAIHELRRRKHREQKPLAVMFPSVAELRTHAIVEDAQIALLLSPAAPIVLVRRRASALLAPSVAPGNPWIGALLPYSPLHVLLLDAFGGPLVATSGNLSEEPLCVENQEALSRLAGVADSFLVHDRAIARPVDDSVVRLARSGTVLLRRARGLAPSPLPLPADAPAAGPLLCVGGHLKNTVAITAGRNVVVSPHIGDLSNPIALGALRRTVELLTELYEARCERVACDAHPDYDSTTFARSLGVPVIPVQHHLAHVLACLLEHDGGPGRVLGVAWDGTGYGDDGTVWGGEFILVDRAARRAERVAHLKSFVLPGGEIAVREPRRCLLGALHAGGIASADDLAVTAETLGFSRNDAAVFTSALVRGLHAATTTSAGRLFDAVAAALELSRRNAFEGQAAMSVEFAADSARNETRSLPWELVAPTAIAAPWQIDWAPALAELRKQRAGGSPVGALAMRFHRMLAQAIVGVARAIEVSTVALTGGCFQNAVLLDLATEALQAEGFTVLRHRELPPNDNSISAGQALGALWGITSTGAASDSAAQPKWV